ncbi:hypothetical protein [Saccharibacillus deserti]|nr:hypothetical protein [Saccharibacillus deserti]
MLTFKESFGLTFKDAYRPKSALSELHIDEASVRRLSACALLPVKA